MWYGPDEEVMVLGPGESAPEGWVQDEDVLDTWFSSALWPFSTLGWPEKTADVAKFYPTSVLVTGYDILFFWVARMMIMGLFAMDGVQPFDVIALHGLVRDKNGKKMSKSRGNTIDPIEFMDKYGSDALRFSLARGANPGADMALAEEWIAGSRNFTTKLWNATRFAMMNGATVDGPLSSDLQTPEQWILTRLSEVIAQSDVYLEKFEFAKACDLIYHFAWDDFCDWYLEMTKHSLATATEIEADKVRRVVGHVIDQLLRLLHPVIPFITEELWVGLTGGESLVIAEWPVVGTSYPNSLAPIAHLQEFVGEIRRFRSDQGLQPARRIPAKISGLGELTHLEGEIRSLTRLTPPEEGFASSADLQVGTTRVDIDLSGTIDVAAERTRLEKDLAAVVKEIEDSSARLGNSDFVGKAPAAVVEKIQKRLVDAVADRERIQDQLSRLGK